MTEDERLVLLAPGQGAPAPGMGRAWSSASPAAAEVFRVADAVLGERHGAALSTICFEGPVERLNRTDVSQPAIFACSVASARALREEGGALAGRGLHATAGLSLGEYTALHLADVFDLETGLELVAERGRLMQAAAERSDGSMVALIGADDEQARDLCAKVTAEPGAGVLVPANFNAPGQVVLSGDRGACTRAVALAGEAGFRATPLAVAGAFHSPLMQPAADGLAEALAGLPLKTPNVTVWSNVTAEPHVDADLELLKRRLVEQLVRPVRWAEICRQIAAGGTIECHELAPGSVLRGLMRRIDRRIKVSSHDEP